MFLAPNVPSAVPTPHHNPAKKNLLNPLRLAAAVVVQDFEPLPDTFKSFRLGQTVCDGLLWI